VPGLGTTLGRGGATTFPQDLVNSDCILIMGSNMAEAHPVAFANVVKAKERGALVIHVDPHYSRTSALANLYVATRAGSDIVFLGAIIRYLLEHKTYFHEYVVNYTNAAMLIREDFGDTEDGDGLFSGFDKESETYADQSSWDYQRDEHGKPLTDSTLQHPQCVFQIMRRHFARYTPELVEDVCGVSQEQWLQVTQTLVENSNREHTTSLCGWLDTTIKGSADHPRSCDYTIVTGQYWTARWRNHGLTWSCLNSGLN
jgi:formate dehydrogenase major subunit